MKKWYENKSDYDNIIVSTSVRLARNIEKYPFPARLDENTAVRICSEVKDAADRAEGLNLMYLDMQDLSVKQCVALAERNLISPDFASPKKGRALLVSEDESISVMINEHDHIRIQVMKSGLDPDEAYYVADKIDDVFDQSFKYAFDDKLGYLTELPTNLGTGMKASVNLQLPAISKCGQISKLASTVSKLGLSLRSAYGDSISSGYDIYKLSNQVTLGISEQTAIDNLKAIAMQIATQERHTSESLVKNLSVMDEIQRAYAVLSSARLLTTSEMLKLFSLVRLGAENGIVKVDVTKLNELTQTLQSATLSVSNGGDIPSSQRDEIRDKTVREQLFDS